MRNNELLIIICIVVTLAVTLSNSESTTRHEPKRVLFVAYYQKSPVISLQGIAEELVRRGHKVQFAITEDDIDLVSSVSEGVEILNAGKAPILPPTHDFFSLWNGEGEFATLIYDKLLPTLKENPPDLVVFEPLSIAGEGFAKTLGVDSIQVIPHLLGLGILGSEPSSSHPMVVSGFAYKNMTFLDRVKNGILIQIARYVLPLVREYIQSEHRSHLGLSPQYTESQNPYGKTKLAILGNVLGFENPRELPPMIQTTGPFLPRNTFLSESTARWISSSNVSIIYVSIGTNSIWTNESANAVLEGLLQITSKHNYRVLWSIKSEHIEFINPQIYSKLKTNDSVIRLESFVDQFAVLSHPLTKAFVTHAGLSSVTESLWNGIPYVAIPMMLESDQPTIGARSQELGVGVWIDRRSREVTSIQFYIALERVLTDSSFRKAAERFKTIYHMSGGARKAADLIELSLYTNVVDLWQPIEDYTYLQCFFFVILLYVSISWIRK